MNPGTTIINFKFRQMPVLQLSANKFLQTEILSYVLFIKETNPFISYFSIIIFWPEMMNNLLI
jgi:hypothetical protein